MNDYYSKILDNLENKFQEAKRRLGLDKILDDNRPKIYITKSKRFGGLTLQIFGKNIIIMNKKLFSHYKDLISTYFHERIHTLRNKNSKRILIRYGIALSSIALYYLYPQFPILSLVPWSYLLYDYISSRTKYGSIDETVTEALAILFLSKIFGKEYIRDMIRNDYKIDEKVRDNYIIRVKIKSKIKRILWRIEDLIFSNYSDISYYLGDIIGYLLSNIDEEKQKEIAYELIFTYNKKKLREILVKIRNYLPKNNELINYYNKAIKYLDGEVKKKIVYS